jgi:hypothetical protein
MFGWKDKRPGPGPWHDIGSAPEGTVLILAVRQKTLSGGAGGPIYYPAAARIGWMTWPGNWTDFTTGAPLDIEPEVFMELPAITTDPPILRFGKARRNSRRPAP